MKKILVVDDEHDFIFITKLNLENTGKYRVMTMSDGRDIPAKVRSFEPDLILLDILMPKIDGVEICGLLNNDPQGQKIPIIILSALDTEKDRRKLYGLGVVDYLAKPVEFSELLTKIEKALQFK